MINLTPWFLVPFLTFWSVLIPLSHPVSHFGTGINLIDQPRSLLVYKGIPHIPAHFSHSGINRDPTLLFTVRQKRSESERSSDGKQGCPTVKRVVRDKAQGRLNPHFLVKR